jgi:hypothetical protein
MEEKEKLKLEAESKTKTHDTYAGEVHEGKAVEEVSPTLDVKQIGPNDEHMPEAPAVGGGIDPLDYDFNQAGQFN